MTKFRFEQETMLEILEKLRAQAEQETAEASTTRRPSWAPALVLSDELLDVCRSLAWLSAGAKPVARLWSVSADLKRIGTWQRDHLSNVPRHGHRVRGFDLIAGEQRTGPRRICRRLKNENGQWDESPRWIEPPRPQRLSATERTLKYFQEFLARPPLTEEALRERSGLDYLSDDDLARRVWLNARERERMTIDIPGLEAKIGTDATAYESARERYRLHTRAFELGRQRIAEFLGDPETQMLAGSRVTGCCSRCRVELTDPTSIERGIGPECIKRVAWHRVVPSVAA